jgi:hypothetical protein
MKRRLTKSVFLRGAPLYALVLLNANSVFAAFSYATCPTNSWTTIPVIIGMNDEYERSAEDGTYYADHFDYQWNVHFNKNVNAFMVKTKDFHTETCCDYLDMTANSTTKRFKGDYSDAYQYGTYLQPASYATFYWHTDYSVARQSYPRIDEIAVYCNSGNAPVESRTISANNRIEGILIGDGDVQYFKVLQEMSTTLFISLDVLSATPYSSVDFDLYVSYSTPYPDNSNYNLRGYHGNGSGSIYGGGEYLVVPHVDDDRWVYIGVRSYTGKGHFVLHASQTYLSHWNADSDMKICTDDNFNTSHPNWNSYVRTLRVLSGRVTQMTNGGRVPSGYSHLRGACNDKYCTNISGCDMVMNVDHGCGVQASGERFIIPYIDCTSYSDDPAELAFTLAHEWAHAHVELHYDEYEVISWSGRDMGPFCGHSILNGPDLGNGRSHTLCTGLNHCEDPAWSSKSGRYFTAPSGFDCSDNGSAWYHIEHDLDYPRLPETAIPASNRTQDQWDSLRRNEVWLANINVAP